MRAPPLPPGPSLLACATAEPGGQREVGRMPPGVGKFGAPLPLESPVVAQAGVVAPGPPSASFLPRCTEALCARVLSRSNLEFLTLLDVEESQGFGWTNRGEPHLPSPPPKLQSTFLC
ncbi:hypothetical protein LEMLEM_LOCUS14405 [Lemmus lemmus]